MQGGRGIKGENWENCNSIINKIYFFKKLKWEGIKIVRYVYFSMSEMIADAIILYLCGEKIERKDCSVQGLLIELV